MYKMDDVVSSKKKCGRPPKRIIIDNDNPELSYNTKVIDVKVIKINDKKYLIDECDNYIYNISNHENIGILVENKIIFKNDELQEDKYVY